MLIDAGNFWCWRAECKGLQMRLTLQRKRTYQRILAGVSTRWRERMLGHADIPIRHMIVSKTKTLTVWVLLLIQFNTIVLCMTDLILLLTIVYQRTLARLPSSRNYLDYRAKTRRGDAHSSCIWEWNFNGNSILVCCYLCDHSTICPESRKVHLTISDVRLTYVRIILFTSFFHSLFVILTIRKRKKEKKKRKHYFSGYKSN